MTVRCARAGTEGARDRHDGRGDAFVGSFAFFLASGLEARDAQTRAGRVASVSVQHRGAQASFPRADELPADLVT